MTSRVHAVFACIVFVTGSYFIWFKGKWRSSNTSSSNSRFSSHLSLGKEKKSYFKLYIPYITGGESDVIIHNGCPVISGPTL